MKRVLSIKSVAAQAALLIAVLSVLLWFVDNALTNLTRRGITAGFGFLERAARFPISESLLNYAPTDSFAWAYVVGLANTLTVSLLVGAIATAFGFALALARRSSNVLARSLSATYTEAIRNTPLVVQLLFWYAGVTLGLPNVHEAINLAPGVWLSDRGLVLPTISVELTNFSFELSMPQLQRFNFTDCLTLTPEFVALLLGLTFYSASFIGEVIRGGINAVDGGQWEAARAVGLSESQALRRVVFPQALRIIIPPLTSQYINVIKNTTLALVVGFPDIAFVTATTINQTGQAVEGIFILMLVFVTISVAASLFMNRYNASVALVER